MYKKHTEEEWQQVFRLYINGISAAQIAKKTKLDKNEVFCRCLEYEQSGIFPTGRRKYSQPMPMIKKKVIDDISNKTLSFSTAAVKYGISLTTIKRWLRKFRHGGYEELLATKPKGRPPKMPRKKKSAKGMTELERLRERVEYLEAENAYLKKLKALDQEENAEMFGIGPRQSED